MSSTHLIRGKLNIGLVQEQARKELLDLLDTCDGSKTIIWDDGLSGPFGLIAEYSLLKKRDAVKMYPLRPGKLKMIETENVIFITRPLLKLMSYINDNIHHSDENSHKRKKWHLYFVPTKSLLCEEYLKNKGVFGSFTSVEHIPGCLLFPFDNDLISMELDTAFRDYYVDLDTTCIYEVAKAVIMLQDLYGPIRKISGKGNAAHQVVKLLHKLENEPRSNSTFRSTTSVQIDQLVLIDRGIDLLSPLVTQLTYEGLIDELFGINNCAVKLPADKFGRQEEDFSETQQDKSLILNSADEIFTEIRDKNFFAVGQSLSRRAKQMSSLLGGHDGRSVQEMKQFVEKLPQMLAVKKCLANHMTVAEMIKEKTDSEDFIENMKNEQDMLQGVITDKVHPYIEDCMARKLDIVKVLRLICMHSVVNCGLKPKVLEQYKRDIVQTYGFQHILTLSNLEKVGLLKIQQGTRSYTVLRKTLKLAVEETNNIAPKDIHYVYGIYAPLTVRLAQQFAKPNGIRNINDVISLLPGQLFDQLMPQYNSKILNQRRGSLSSQNDSSNVILVFFIGGCTFAEISALRFLSQQEDLNVEFVIATTKIINGNTFIKSLMEPLT